MHLPDGGVVVIAPRRIESAAFPGHNFNESCLRRFAADLPLIYEWRVFFKAVFHSLHSTRRAVTYS